MLDAQYFLSLTSELESLRNRVRSFIKGAHWLTDGEWKESVLRSLLRRNLPKTVQVGRGFVITENGASTQIDILIHDSTKPVLFQDGDLAFVTPDAVLGIIEVKTSVTHSTFRESMEILCNNSRLLQAKQPARRFYGLFSFDDRTGGEADKILNTIKESVRGEGARIVHCICLGDSKFIRYWNTDPEGERVINVWRAYRLERMAPGYFIHNAIEQICPQSVALNEALWYPREGKEDHKIAEIGLR